MTVSAGLIVCLVAACGGSDQPDSDRPGSGAGPGPGASASAAPVAVKSFDPPLKFGAKVGDALAGGEGQGKWAVRLEGTTAYASSDDEVRAVGALDGKKLWSVKPQGQPAPDTDSGTSAVASPTLVQIDGKPAVLAAFAVIVPGSGTTPGRGVIELTAVAADSGSRLWTATVDRPDGRHTGDPVLLGSDGTTAVIRLGNEATFGVALATRQAVWTAKGFFGDFVDRGIVVGRGEGAGASGLAIADGKEAWTYRGSVTEAEAVGAGLFTVAASEPTTRTRSAALLDVSTGRPPTGLDEKSLGELTGLSCEHDQRSTVVCSAADKRFQKRVFALDTTTFKQLWVIDGNDTSRLLPRVTSAWHGAVYADTSNGPVVLDTLTGKDKATAPGVAPEVVNGYVGLTGTNPEGVRTLDGIRSHPAVG